MQFLLAGQVALNILELDLAELRVAPQLEHLERGGVGGDFQQRLARLDEVTDFGEPSPYYSTQSRLDAHLDPGLDRADGDCLIDQRAASHFDCLRLVALLVAELTGGRQGAEAENGDRAGDGEHSAALHLRRLRSGG